MEQDTSKTLAFLEVAAKKGSVRGHDLLGMLHEDNGNISKSIEHRKVLAHAGHKESMDQLMNAYKEKEISKEELTHTLRAYQASIALTKNQDRDDARIARVVHDYMLIKEA